MRKGTNEVIVCGIWNQLEDPSLSLCSCLDGPRKAMLGVKSPWPSDSMRLFFSFCKASLHPKPVWSLTLLLSPRIMILKILCLSIPSQYLGGEKAARALSSWLYASLLASLTQFCPHPSWDCPSFKSKYHRLLWRMSMWLQLCPRWCQLITLSHVISAWAGLDMLLINEAFALRHKTIEYPSHPINCVTKLITRWPSLVPGRRDQVSKPLLTSWWEEIILKDTHKGKSKVWV